MPNELSRREIRRRRCSRLTALLHRNPSTADPRTDSRRTPEICLRIPPLLEESESPMGSEQPDTASDRACESFEVAAESGNKGKARGGGEISSVGEGIQPRRSAERSVDDAHSMDATSVSHWITAAVEPTHRTNRMREGTAMLSATRYQVCYGSVGTEYPLELVGSLALPVDFTEAGGEGVASLGRKEEQNDKVKDKKGWQKSRRREAVGERRAADRDLGNSGKKRTRGPPELHEHTITSIAPTRPLVTSYGSHYRYEGRVGNEGNDGGGARSSRSLHVLFHDEGVGFNFRTRPFRSSADAIAALTGFGAVATNQIKWSTAHLVDVHNAHDAGLEQQTRSPCRCLVSGGTLNKSAAG
ncbi:hypothetical protein B296_00036862 [Ensete ventricosum]|uniref:Uncharacterized protein n=1 Tax=Ensete ventricosum TaxID=4639 RepID=A0A426YLV5_ENSVE|nr:hypothetical protein B296_00036862 [Ensete ventricosum]